MDFNNLNLTDVYPHNFNDATLATTKLMEDLATKTTNGKYIQVAPNVFLYISGEDGSCNMIASTPLHYFYSHVNTGIPSVIGSSDEDDKNDAPVSAEPSVVENDEPESETESGESESGEDDSTIEDSCANISDSGCDADSTSDDDSVKTPVLIDDANAESTLDLAHNVLAPTVEPTTNGLQSISVVLPLGSDDLINDSKNVENAIASKYAGKIFRHNDLMFTHIRPDGVIDRVTTDSTGHNCTSYK